MRTLWILLTVLAGLISSAAWADDEPKAVDNSIVDAGAEEQSGSSDKEQPGTPDTDKDETAEAASDEAADEKKEDAEDTADDADTEPAATEETPPAQDPSTAESPDEATEATSDEAGPLQTEKDKISYAIGVSIGRGLKRDGADIDAELVGRGLANGFQGSGLLLSDAQVRDAILAFRRNLKAAAAGRFLEQNASREDVVKLPSGLQYRVIKEGDGAVPKGSDTVEVHYRGTLIDGREFDSSFKRNKSAEFKVDDVIAGWTEALKLMKVGSKWELAIPPELAYGNSPPPGSIIAPGDVLVFEVELLGIK